MDPVVSWTLFGTGVAAIGYYYYTENQKKIARAREIGGRRRGSHPRLDGREKRVKAKDSGSSDHVASDSADVPSPSGSGNEGAKKRKAVKKQPSKLSYSSAVDSGGNALNDEIDEEEDEGMNNVEFAEQFINKQVGTDLKKRTGPADQQRSKKQNKNQELTTQSINGSAMEPTGAKNMQLPSAASSTTGADADDDLSPANSPQLGALSNATPSATDVADMLEAPAKGPSVLNITAPVNPQPSRQPKQPKAVHEPETKRQRQNRKKREEQKALREEAENERRVLLENQLRTVREAEGRPAKNGLGITKAPTNNAWSKTAEINGGLKASLSTPNQSDTPLLDTFEDSQSSANGATSISGLDAYSESSPQAPSSSTFTSSTDLPSEEEQLRIISEMDSDNAWSTVNKGGKSRKTKPAASATSVPNGSTSFDNSKNPKVKQQPTSKFAALDVEHLAEEASNMDKEEEVAALEQPTNSAKKESFHNMGSSSITLGEDMAGGLPDSLLANDNREDLSSSNPVNDMWSDKPTSAKSITGLAIPDFVFLQPCETQIERKAPAEDLPEGWYHFDNGCRSGNKKIPHHDVEYERQLQKHARWTSDNQEVLLFHRKKTKLERDAYDKCFLVYRAHLARTLDSHMWNKDNIKEHPAYEPDWPWALLPHPSEDWSAGYHEPSRDCPICEDYSR